jgi:pilus assembly protein CpaE
MHAYIISNHEATTIKVREVLLQQAVNCPAAHVLSLDLAVAKLAGTRPDFIVLILSPDVELGLSVLAHVPNSAQSRLLVIGPASDPKLILQALRLGADHYIDEADPLPELAEGIQRLRADAGLEAEPGRLISILAPSGGSGSTTLAANIATVLAKAHGKCALIDLKLESGDLASLLDLKPAHTLADLCQNAARLDRVMFERSLVPHSSGVHLLAPTRTFAEVSQVTTEGVRQAMALARLLFPYVVVDVDHWFREEQIVVLRQSDVIILVMRLDFTSVRNMKRTMEHLERLGIDKGRVHLVVNRYGQPKEVPAAKAEEALGVKIAHFIPEDAKTVNRANNSGIPVVLESPSAKVSKCVSRLAASVNGRAHPGK